MNQPIINDLRNYLTREQITTWYINCDKHNCIPNIYFQIPNIIMLIIMILMGITGFNYHMLLTSMIILFFIVIVDYIAEIYYRSNIGFIFYHIHNLCKSLLK